METKEKTEEKKPLNTDIERKRELITISVSPDEKRRITRMAVSDCGISVSEFIRTKVFLESPKPTEPIQESPLKDEEREIYEEKIREFSEEIQTLKDTLVKTKVLNTNVEDIAEISEAMPENAILIELEPELKQLLDQVKKFRDEKALTLNPEKLKEFYDYNTFLKLILLRGFRRSYGLSSLNENTGLKWSDFNAMVELCKIDGWDI